MWKRGTELPWPPADQPPRSAQPTNGKNLMPRCTSHDRFSPAAKATYASAQRPGQQSSARSKPAVASQSLHARSHESRMPRRRRSGESTRIRPPGVDEFARGHQAGQARSDDDDVRVIAHTACSLPRYADSLFGGNQEFPLDFTNSNIGGRLPALPSDAAVEYNGRRNFSGRCPAP